MVVNDLLAETLSVLNNAEKRSKTEFLHRPTSKTVAEVLKILKENSYIKDFEHIKDSHGGQIKVKLTGAINKVGVIKPRFSVQVSEIERFEKRYLPAKNFGLIIMSTPKGMMTHNDAKKQNQGGVLIAYVY